MIEAASCHHTVLILVPVSETVEPDDFPSFLTMHSGGVASQCEANLISSQAKHAISPAGRKAAGWGATFHGMRIASTFVLIWAISLPSACAV